MPFKDKDKRLEVQREHYARNAEKVKQKTRRHRDKKKKEWQEYKKTLACVKCGQNHPATLDFHHVIKHPSNNKLNELIRRNAWSLVYAELAKCVVLCSNCHRIHHHNELMLEKRIKRKKKVLAQDTHTHYHTHKPNHGGDNAHSDETTDEVPALKRVTRRRKSGKETE